MSSGWNVSIDSAIDGEAGGDKENTASITGKGVDVKLKFEFGVHHALRVPYTVACGISQ
jgi:peptide chain release factor 1